MSKLFLIPNTLGETSPSEVLPAKVLDTIPRIRIFVVEELRSARRFLSASGLKGHIDELEFHVLNEHNTGKDVEELAELFNRGDVGLISEAGLPAVADPGSDLVALCHRLGIEVIPLVGPSSLMLALMGSGLNGQSFAFKGYLPAKTDERRNALREAESISRRLKQSQIFIETPYRNDAILQDMISFLSDTTDVCIAADLTLSTMTIITKKVGQWRKMQNFSIGKRPCVFLMLAQ